MERVRVGVIGLGHVGLRHALCLLGGTIQHARLAAVATRTESRLRRFRRAGIPAYSDRAELIRSGEVDAVIIATPHADHVPAALLALRHGLHVLLEKPVAVHVREAQKLIRAHRGVRRKLGVMFNLRTDSRYARIRELVREGELGKIQRMSWTFTEWYRPQAYYDADAWRGTWSGEGGGVLINQAAHHLDLLQWMFGMPSRVEAHCAFGRYHRIEVEDEVAARLEFPGGATGVFVFSTGEAPGINHLEVAGDRGLLVFDGRIITLARNAMPTGRHIRTATGFMARPASTRRDIHLPAAGGGTADVIRNFVDAIQGRASLVAPAAEGLRSLELGNAMVYSGVTGRPVRLPMNPGTYARLLNRLVKEHK